MEIDNDTQKYIDLMLENKVPKIESLTPEELRDMRAKMSSVPSEKLVKIENSTCSKCYALKLQKLRPSVDQGWTNNLLKAISKLGI